MSDHATAQVCNTLIYITFWLSRDIASPSSLEVAERFRQPDWPPGIQRRFHLHACMQINTLVHQQIRIHACRYPLQSTRTHLRHTHTKWHQAISTLLNRVFDAHAFTTHSHALECGSFCRSFAPLSGAPPTVSTRQRSGNLRREIVEWVFACRLMLSLYYVM